MKSKSTKNNLGKQTKQIKPFIYVQKKTQNLKKNMA